MFIGYIVMIFTKKIYQNAGNVLTGIQPIQPITASTNAEEGQIRQQEIDGLFTQMKKLLHSSKTKFRFEVSDLRRTQLEALCLRKSLENAVKSDAFLSQIQALDAFPKSETLTAAQKEQINQQKIAKRNAIRNNLENSDFTILHSMSESSSSARSASVLKEKVPFYPVTGDKYAAVLREKDGKHRDSGVAYWDYLKNGMPKGAYYDGKQEEAKRWTGKPHPVEY